MEHKKTAGILRIVILSFILSATIGYSLADWVAPAGGPPSNNIPPPVNVGSASQVRDGNLFLNNWLIAKKARTQSTVATDAETTLVTKDYIDNKTLTCKTVTTGVVSDGTATCPSGYTLTGGSCDMTRNGGDGREIGWRYCHQDGNGMYCVDTNAGLCAAYAYCCK